MTIRDLLLYSKSLAGFEAVLMAVLLLVMVHRGLARRYRMFVLYLALQVVGRTIYLVFTFRSDLYGYWYVLSTPVNWVLSFLVIHELYANILADFPGIVSFGKWVIGSTFVLAVGISLMTARFDWNLSAHEDFPIIYYYTFIARGITTAQVVYLLAMTTLLRWFPTSLKRNIRVHTVLLFLYFLTRSATLLTHNLLPGERMTMIVNLVVLAVSCLCVCAWIGQLAPEVGDNVRSGGLDRAEETRLFGTLRSLNDALLGAGKLRPER
jgi:hypothetical protein